MSAPGKGRLAYRTHEKGVGDKAALRRREKSFLEIPELYWTTGTASAKIGNMGKERPRKLSDQIRQAINECGVTRYRIAQETGINESLLSKFYRGQRGLSVGALDTLCEFLGVEIVATKARKKDS